MKGKVESQADATLAGKQKPLSDAVTAKPAELAAHLRDAIQWTQPHRDLKPGNAVIILARNAHDEGGWLQPTLGAKGIPNAERIGVLRRLLHNKAP